MRVSIRPALTAATWKRFATQDLSILLLSIVIQLSLALLFGHFYDMRIFMATGYLVGTGQNPYVGTGPHGCVP